MLEIVILAAGEGKRMHSGQPKVLQPVGGRAMLEHLLDAAAALDPGRLHVVIGAGADQIRRHCAGRPFGWVEQKARRGTGHALMQALPQLGTSSRVLVLPGDMPLIRPETLGKLLSRDADLALLTFVADDPTGYGRILRSEGHVSGVREERDASEAERAIREVNSGVMLASAGDWSAWLQQIDDDNAQGEYYLTDCIGVAAAEGRTIDAVVAGDAAELKGANDRAQLADLERIYQQRARAALLAAGATLLDPDTVHVRGRVEAGRDVTVDVNVILCGDVQLGDGVRVGAGCVLTDCHLAAGTRIEPYSVLEGVRTTGPCDIGPFARLRPGTELAEGVRIGNFVETKKAQFGSGAKASHLAYVGDAEIGAGANLGAGTITCNYDGVNKHRTVIGRGAFIGSNSALVAPVTIGSEATIGAGSVISGQAPAGQLTLARGRQRTVPGWKRPAGRGKKS
ncbi:MAG: bifunctional UDP-N-acetylglucosamine diphosphorylase/glucosamine-1-phosphate N-acetyltransferase GlmU [Pseudomonadota bacterium]|nr:MAG: bifunctional UDP-N-acetylglucosamine diphosphorylase/glucosamine-1-phosphate N-acetyltransferase GlmU [Pseudomonadota bacterium]